MKRYRFVIYALKAVDSLECSTLLETIRKGKHAVETKGESLVMWVQKYEPGTEPSGWLHPQGRPALPLDGKAGLLPLLTLNHRKTIDYDRRK